MAAKVLLLLVAALMAATFARPDSTPGYVVPARPTPSYGAPTQPRPSYNVPAPGYTAPTYVDKPAKYDFNWAVKDDYGNDFGHQETRDGYDTQGSYYVLLPDGRLQKVTYYVSGDSGFVAEVTYEGKAQYPAYQPAPAPSYVPASVPSYVPAPAPSYVPATTPSYRPTTTPSYRPTPTPSYRPTPSYYPTPRSPIISKE